MPELPEVEVLARHLAPLIRDRTIRDARVFRPRVIRPASPARFLRSIRGAKFVGLERRGKYLIFELRTPRRARRVLVGHLGMTGRMFVARSQEPLPKHCSAVFDLGQTRLVFEDTRYFGRLILDEAAVGRLGPEPLGPDFTLEEFRAGLKRSRQAVKVKLLDQSFVAGVGNIYASEALYVAGVAPRLPANRLTADQARRLWHAIRHVLEEAIECGSTVPLNFSGAGARDKLFYFGRAPGVQDYYEERLRVYDRAGRPCPKCGAAIRRLVQAGRSTFYCRRCQPVSR